MQLQEILALSNTSEAFLDKVLAHDRWKHEQTLAHERWVVSLTPALKMFLGQK